MNAAAQPLPTQTRSANPLVAMSPLQYYRALVIVNGAVPLAVLGWDAYRGQLGANSVNYAIHVTGILSLVFLFLSLAITPLRWLTGWGGWIALRRSLGLFGFFYSLLHVAIYFGLDREASISSTAYEIWTRRFLQVGTAAVFLMIPLAITSTNTMIQRLGPARWKLLHRLAYLVAILAVVHYYLLVKSDVRQPVAFAVILTGLLGYRFGKHYFELRKSAIQEPGSAPLKKSSMGTTAKRKFWTGSLKVIATFQETPDVRTFRLGAIDGGPLPFEYLPGQYLNLQLMIEGRRVHRSYTIASSPTRRDACELSIKREPMGTASRAIHDHWKVGSTIQVSAPAGRFVFTGNDSDRVLLIAGGVGITPIMSMVRYLTDRAWSGEIYLLVIAKTESDIIFREEIEYLQRRFSHLHVAITLTRAEGNDSWSGHRGRATAELLNRLVPNVPTVPVFICGPDAMMEATRSLLVDMGVPNDQVKTEAFVSPAMNASNPSRATEGEADQVAVEESGPDSSKTTALEDGASITFARSQVQVQVESSTSILEAAETQSIDLPFECRAGICGQCKTRLLKGKVAMACEDALSPSEKSSGWILACQAQPTSDIVVDA